MLCTKKLISRIFKIIYLSLTSSHYRLVDINTTQLCTMVRRRVIISQDHFCSPFRHADSHRLYYIIIISPRRRQEIHALNKIRTQLLLFLSLLLCVCNIIWPFNPRGNNGNRRRIISRPSSKSAARWAERFFIVWLLIYHFVENRVDIFYRFHLRFIHSKVIARNNDFKFLLQFENSGRNFITRSRILTSPLLHQKLRNSETLGCVSMNTGMFNLTNPSVLLFLINFEFPNSSDSASAWKKKLFRTQYTITKALASNTRIDIISTQNQICRVLIGFIFFLLQINDL